MYTGGEEDADVDVGYDARDAPIVEEDNPNPDPMDLSTIAGFVSPPMRSPSASSKRKIMVSKEKGPEAKKHKKFQAKVISTPVSPPLESRLEEGNEETESLKRLPSPPPKPFLRLRKMGDESLQIPTDSGEMEHSPTLPIQLRRSSRLQSGSEIDIPESQTGKELPQMRGSPASSHRKKRTGKKPSSDSSKGEMTDVPLSPPTEIDPGIILTNNILPG